MNSGASSDNATAPSLDLVARGAEERGALARARLAAAGGAVILMARPLCIPFAILHTNQTEGRENGVAARDQGALMASATAG